MAQWIGADVINLRGGGAYGNKKSALKRLSAQIDKLPDFIRSRLTIENDDRIYTPKDLLSVCRDMGVPLVYDVHHHRCLTDGSSIEKATEAALTTWNREHLFHLSSQLNGWKRKKPDPHHDFINPQDFPECLKQLSITVEIEAKAKELAIK